MKAKIFIGISIVVVILGFLYKSNALSTAHSVDYYMQHKSEMKEKIKACNNDPAGLKDDGNCINANQAMSNIIFEEGKKNTDSVRKAFSSGF